MTFVDAVNELKILLSVPDVPAEVVDCALRLIKCPREAIRVIPDSHVAGVATQVGVCLEPSDRLLQFVSAARAREWEKIIVAEMEHDAPQHTLVRAKV